MLALRRLGPAPGRLPARPPAAAAALHGPGLRALLERWRARRPAPSPGVAAAAAAAAPRRAGPPGDAALQALFSSPPFCHRRPARFARALAGWLPGAVEGLSPATLALIAQYVARHRLRQPPLLDAIAAFLLPRAPRLHPKLRHFPLAVLHQVFSPGFLDNVTSSPCGLIVRRYLSLLDVAVALEVHEYDGPRLDPRFRVCMFDGALTADKVNNKYSCKGLVAEALWQLVGEEGYRQDEVLPPGYCTDFLLQFSHSGALLPRSSWAGAPLEALQTLTGRPVLETRREPLSRPQGLDSRPLAGRRFLPEESLHSWAPQGGGWSQGEEPHTAVLNSSLAASLCGTAESATRFRPPTLGTEPQQPLPAPATSPEAAPDGTQKAEAIHRVVLSVNDEWHYCQNSAVLVGSRAMRDRHLRLLGYNLVQAEVGLVLRIVLEERKLHCRPRPSPSMQLPYMDLQRVSGVEGVKRYLSQKLRGLWIQA
ncbi:fas-activated serine/threonine kinase isoform X3 [Sphaerodactylus townsendi]|uniref:fas-activated serine/threonine kinase isoform X3 n=1 Tax=Sphaerodactylus townsendi TaxID=933632 RepID=UPI002025F09F|nr:fas-activated serine/threonine kinase isoform X3 [Sphaerodactylus townsendi]